MDDQDSKPEVLLDSVCCIIRCGCGCPNAMPLFLGSTTVCRMCYGEYRISGTPRVTIEFAAMKQPRPTVN